MRSVKLDNKQKYITLRNNIAPQVSIRTIRRRLRERNMRKWLAAGRPKLTEEHARKRLEWAKRYKDFTPEDWLKVAWSDESSVAKSRNLRNVWIFRAPGEQYLRNNVVPRTMGNSVSLMVWGCFAGDVRGPFLIFDGIEGRVSGEYYLERMQEELPRFMEYIAERLDTDPIFMQDNAPVHTSGIVKRWLREQDFEMMDWPPFSPDLNLIENLWAIMKDDLRDQYPEIADMRGGPAAIKHRLAEVLPIIWTRISLEVCRSLSKSMVDRVKDIIVMRGWYTRR